MSDYSDYTERRVRFVRLYETHFGKFPVDLNEQMTGDPWYRLVDRIPDHRLEEVMEAVDRNRGKARYRPHLADFKRAWEGLTGQSFGRTVGGCNRCGGRGVVTVIGYLDDRGWHLGLGRKAALVCVPCICEKGDKYSREGSDKRRQGCSEWADRMVGEMQMADFSGGYVWYLEHLLAEHRKAHRDEFMERAAPKKDEPEPAPVLAGPTHISEVLDEKDAPAGPITREGDDDVPF